LARIPSLPGRASPVRFKGTGPFAGPSPAEDRMSSGTTPGQCTSRRRVWHGCTAVLCLRRDFLRTPDFLLHFFPCRMTVASNEAALCSLSAITASRRITQIARTGPSTGGGLSALSAGRPVHRARQGQHPDAVRRLGPRLGEERD